MAAQLTHDVVKEAQSMGAPSSIGDIANHTTSAPADSGHQLPIYSQINADDSADIQKNQPGYDPLQLLDNEATTPLRDPAKSPLSEKALLADASGGSDTDTSKPDVTRKDGAPGHARSNSVKKPTSFKSVSVTKNFLAKAAVGTPTSRPGEKAPSSNQATPINSAAKPRLVAKSALGALGARSGIRGSGSTAGPDASQVWNKNRPTPPPAPRTFTDEELKQQYGIHMATRLPADEAGKESKWADIDDDEDDWAPETVTWLDGTKSTVAQPETKPEIKPPQPQHIEEPVQEPALSLALPKLGVITPSTGPSSTKTILKPGSHSLAQSKSSGGLILKGAPEKPKTTASGSIAPVPAKSPWAPLPPVDKVSPVQFAPPVQPPPQRFSRDPTGFDAFQTLPSPKEIEVDDFNRVYDQPRNRELYNSQSGRFEPATELRKGQGRHEHSHRQPAVLQRPPYGQHGAPEPSPAFQTSRSGNDASNWSRHRAGSTSSTGRRMSVGRPSEVPSKVEISDVAPAPHDEQVAEDTVAHVDVAQPQEPIDSLEPEAPQTPLEPQEDPVAKQQRLMREKIELAKQAKQRRIEEEEREERARKERLRLKVAALAGATPSPPAEPKEKPIENHAHIPNKSPQIQKAALMASPPKPPIPTAEGEVAQYGMMKVHQPHPVKKTNVSESSLMSRTIMDSPHDRRNVHSEHTPQRNDQAPSASSTTDKTQLSAAEQKRSSALPEASPWRTGAAPEGYAGWASSSTNNVWGPPRSKDRALGNGTFDTAAFRGIQGGIQAPRQIVHPNPASFGAPGPIAPPVTQVAPQSTLATSRSLHERAGPYDANTRDRGLDLDVSDNAIPPGLPSHETPPFAHHLPSSQRSHHGHFVDPQSLNNLSSMPPKAGPQEYQRNSTFKNNAPALDEIEEQRRHEAEVAAKWNAVTDNSLRQNEERLRRLQEHYDREQGGRATLAVRSAPDHPTVIEPSGINGIGIPQQPGQAAQQKPIVPIGQSTTALSSQRASRFFPRAAGPRETSEKSDSPPPPEQSSLDSGHGRVVVNIPKVPIVKLPPSQPVPPTPRVNPVDATSSTPQKAAGQASNWQDRIDSLLQKGKPRGALNTSSRAPLDVSSFPSATVSLPAAAKLRRRPLFSTDSSSDPQSKSSEEDLFPQPEFGSTPTIHLPPKGHVYKDPAKPPAYRAHQSIMMKQMKEVERDFGQTISFVEIKKLFDSANHKDDIIIKLQYMVAPKTVVLPHSSPRINLTRGASGSYRGRRGQESSYPSSRGNRRSSGPQTTPSDPSSPTSRGGSSRGGTPRTGSSRGSFRHQSSNGHISKRNISAPVQRAT